MPSNQWNPTAPNYDHVEEAPLTLAALQRRAHETARAKGFWNVAAPLTDQTYRMFLSQKLALVHEEVSEALQELRKPGAVNADGALGTELADAVIRLADLAAYLQIDLAKEANMKMAKNEQRPVMHGKAF